MARHGDNLVGALLLLAVLLILPGVAAWPWGVRHGLEWMLAPLALSALSFGVYAFDKRQAGRRADRIPEVRLLLLDLLGGWPGGWLAQRLLRHKNAKASYQFAFWGIVATHQVAAAWLLFR